MSIHAYGYELTSSVGRCLLELHHTEKITVEKYTVTYDDTRIHLHTNIRPSQCASHNIHKHL